MFVIRLWIVDPSGRMHMMFGLGVVLPRLPGLPLVGGTVIVVGGLIIVVPLVEGRRLVVMLIVPRFRLMGGRWRDVIITLTMFIALMWYFTEAWGVRAKTD